MSRRRPIRSEVWEAEPVWTRARVLRDGDGEAAQISDISSWGVWVYDLGAARRATQVYAISDQAPSDGSWYDTLQTSGWTTDAVGYNFAHALQPSDMTLLGDRAHRAEYRIVTVSDGTIVLVHEFEVQGLYSS